jgi:ribosomal subunit interface protein
MIEIQIRERNIDISRALRAHAEGELDRALAPFGTRIARVIVRFSSDEGAGARESRCQIHIGLRSRSARAEGTGVDFFAAVDRACERLSRAIAQVLERERVWNAAETSRVL